MLRQLFSMGVQPEALLPRRPDPGRCRLCHPDSLTALVDVLIERCSGDLSRHKEVTMRSHLRAWCPGTSVSREEAVSPGQAPGHAPGCDMASVVRASRGSRLPWHCCDPCAHLPSSNIHSWARCTKGPRLVLDLAWQICQP